MKQVLEIQLHLEVRMIELSSIRDLLTNPLLRRADIIVLRPQGSVVDLLNKMRRRRTNRRNTEVVIAFAPEMDDGIAKRIQSYLEMNSEWVASAA